jgi:hypothetical protein
LKTETPIKDIKNKWKDSPCLWIRRNNIVKMFILLKAIYKFETIPTHIAMLFFFHQNRKKTTKILMETHTNTHTHTQISKPILNKNNKAEVVQYTLFSSSHGTFSRITIC